MSKTLPSADGCKGAFSWPSHTKDLARATSHGASTRGLTGLVNSYPKALLAAFFFGLTNYVIFEDVLRHGASITTDHLLSFGVLIGTFAAGHWFWPTARQWQLGGALGLALLFCVGTVYCVITSAGRNAEALTAKASKVAADDGPRAALERQVKGADTDLTEAKAKLEEAENETKAAEDKAASLCRKYGAESWRCSTEKGNVDAPKGREADKQKAVEDKTNTYYMLDARLRAMTKKEANGDLKYAAKVLGYLGLTVTDDALVDLIPFAKSLFCEFMTLVLASGAFAHRRETATVTPPKEPETVSPPMTVPRDRPTVTVLRLAHGGTVPEPQQAALVLLRQSLAVNGAVPQGNLTVLFGDVSKQTVSRWCDEWEKHQIIAREPIGRTKIVRLSKVESRVDVGTQKSLSRL